MIFVLFCTSGWGVPSSLDREEEQAEINEPKLIEEVIASGDVP